MKLAGQSFEALECVTSNAVLHVIAKSRLRKVIREVMGDTQAEVWVSNCWKPQLWAKAKARQLCLCHQIRNLEGLIEKAPRLRWARELQRLLRTAIHLDKQRAEMKAEAFQRRVRRIERRLDKLLARQVKNPLADALVARYRERRDQLLVF